MANKRIVSSLPSVQITAQVPKIADNVAIMPMGTQWANMEMEAVLGIAATMAARNGAWVPVSVHDFFDLLARNNWWITIQQNVPNALWALFEAGLLEIIRLVPEGADEEKGTDYIIPTEAFAASLWDSSVTRNVVELRQRIAAN